MAAITANLKEGLKYPLLDNKKFLIVYVLNLLIFALIILSNYKIILNFSNLQNPVITINTILSLISPEVILGIIASIIISIILKGYSYKLIQSGINHSKELPDFNIDLIVLAFKLIIVDFVYAIIPILFLILGSNNSALLSIGYILFIILGLICIIAETHVVNTGNLKCAFEFGDIFELIQSFGILNYIGAYIFYEFTYIIISFVLAILLLILIFILIPFGILTLLIVSILTLSLLSTFILISKYYVYGTLYDLMNKSE